MSCMVREYELLVSENYYRNRFKEYQMLQFDYTPEKCVIFQVDVVHKMLVRILSMFKAEFLNCH
jgi:hypothetical protein